MVVCPVDPLVEDGYFTALRELSDLAATKHDGLCLMGIEPTYPSEKYGYILPEARGAMDANGARPDVFRVRAFKDKPDEEAAKEYISQGALWNGGVLAYRIGYLLGKTEGSTDYQGFYDKYEALDYHSHERRDEVWTVISGSGVAIVDGVRREIRVGDVVSMPAGCRHTVTAVTRLEMIEVQLGKDISVHDKVRHELLAIEERGK